MTSSTSERPVGQRFSHVYLGRDDLLEDSARARRRVAALLYSMKDLENLSTYFVSELGVDVKWHMSGVDWPNTLGNVAPRDFLDLFTVAYRFLANKRKGGKGMYNPYAADAFIKEAARILEEESLCYELDAFGGVHFKVDQQFAATTNAAIAALGAPRYVNAKAEFDNAMAALSRAEIDGKQGIRGVFNSVECVYKLMFQRAPKLDAAGAIGSLQPVVQTLYGINPTALRAAGKSINSFADWVDACHNYRHEEGVEEPSQPPVELAVELISVGASFLRWLINIDRQMKAAPGK